MMNLLTRLRLWVAAKIAKRGIFYINGPEVLPAPLSQEDEAECIARLDDERARSLLSVLQKYGKSGGQVILFTCHTREGAMLADDADVTFLSLGEPLTAHL